MFTGLRLGIDRGRLENLSKGLSLKFSKGPVMMRHALLCLAVIPTVAFSNVSGGAETGTLKARFVYDGNAPMPKPISVAPAAAFCGGVPLVDESLLIDPETKGIRNLILYVYTGRGGSTVPETEPPKKTHELANQNCRFEPHVLMTRAGDTLNVTNRDLVGHNTHFNFFANAAANFVIPARGNVQVPVPKAEPAPIPVECNIHPWMKAYVVVLDHPYGGVSAEDGTLMIEGLPAGKPLVFRISHESMIGQLEKVRIMDQWRSLNRNRFEIMIHPGLNDLGDVVIPADAFR